MTREERGFTIIELLIVVLIIGVLTSVAVPSYAAQSRKARLATLKTALRSAATAQEQRGVDGLPYATPGPVGVAQLVAEGYVAQPTVVLSVLPNLADGGFCLRAHHVALAAEYDLFYASSGPRAGRPSPIPCG